MWISPYLGVACRVCDVMSIQVEVAAWCDVNRKHTYVDRHNVSVSGVKELSWKLQHGAIHQFSSGAA